ncbi:protein disulfide isomerase MPD2 KNAG_0K00830 [Huiozyma naganishii CBS 8797]|uniref:Thioredoxin domain-containing protein n=1 Tax=Huiozyma naganishii (strain ATCC MYA-139 / BCRC 22969 / CBS 8797 / KCTC 17520 / NBRC 10181 / NCYC 3082 / Yp74L-3) TaxID=1071383 RepID=J7SA36_HUIN7|nr:hypothetical protein KNAG_0K00830 [Kazachstania naganishii CBS 8797]CCK72449.1 hypothetical protein KNAG_0K00830 [Kazachstania naganishii CBS 8797]
MFSIVQVFVLFICSVGAVVTHIQTQEQFFNLVNNGTATYTVVKYFTQWCTHCKLMKPVYEELSALDTYKAPLQFVEVDCELFGSSLCSGVPGYPMVKLITPLDEPLSLSDSPLTTEAGNLPLWRRLWEKMWGPSYSNPLYQVASDRIIEFKGRRNLPSFQNFLNAAVSQNELRRLFDSVLFGHPAERQPLTEPSLTLHYYYNETVSPMLNWSPDRNEYAINDDKLFQSEIRLLENVIRTAASTAAGDGDRDGDDRAASDSQRDIAETLRLKLGFLNHVAEAVSPNFEHFASPNDITRDEL